VNESVPAGEGRLDPDVLREVYEAHAKAVFDYLARRVGAQEAEDLTMQVFIDVGQSPRIASIARSMQAAYLIGTAKNRLRRHHRSRSREARALQRLPVEPWRPGADATVVARVDGQDELERIIRRLAPDDRVLLDSYLANDGSAAAVSADLGIPVGTVKSRMNRLRLRLRAREAGDGR